ncbi:hypothetical protein Pmani_018626 [Petrolisthes manimaculis]|uniref:DDHD domain-containing protein n=1 Tax=Petrolisthes manimaculis TaxID=1843537 RepID=A0AAE1PM32_9EUCA|nr:hypothetical protein Pmani_018626 [Petrolisthes manimaculis]
MVLVKEYRIPLPLTVEEYRVAQLYMIAKKSRQESHGEGSGVEILVNEPYENGPGPDGRGQYTHKVYHVGSHLPGWLKSLIPKSALSVEEEAWNCYPYTKTRFTCPFIEKFSIEVETYYFDDGGHQDNVFKLSKSELKQREVDLIDVVKDQLYGADYVEEEDPRKYQSQKTGRGPLGDNWIQEYWDMCKDKKTPLSNGEAIMCAYKLCKVEFRYWGMQTKIEKFIHDVALRKTMLRAHRQAWSWLDEWWGLTIEDIRNIEKETQSLLAKKYGQGEDGEEEEDREEGVKENGTEREGVETPEVPHSPSVASDRTPNLEQISKSSSFRTSNDLSPEEEPPPPRPLLNAASARRGGDLDISQDSVATDDQSHRNRGSWSRSGSRNTLNSQNQVNWRMESIRRDSLSSGSDDEFFDCQEELEESTALHKWSSLELLPQDADAQTPAPHTANDDSIFSEAFMSRVVAERQHRSLCRSVEASAPPSPAHSPSHHPSGAPCPTTVLLLVVHAGSVLDPSSDMTNKRSDVTTFRGALESVMRQHYPNMVGHVAIRLIAAPPVCCNSLSILASLSPYGLDASPVCGEGAMGGDSVPVGALPLLACSVPDYDDAVTQTLNASNAAYHEFLRSEEGQGFTGQICIIGDSVGGLLAYDLLCRAGEQGRFGSNSHIPEAEPPSPGQYYCQRPPQGPPPPSALSPTPSPAPSPPSVSPEQAPTSSTPSPHASSQRSPVTSTSPLGSTSHSHSCSSQPASLSALSPTITVSLGDSTANVPEVFSPLLYEGPPSTHPNPSVSSQSSASSKLPSTTSHSSPFSAKSASSTSPPLSSFFQSSQPHTPKRKISAPLPTPTSLSFLSRKCSAPCTSPAVTPSPSPPGHHSALTASPSVPYQHHSRHHSHPHPHSYHHPPLHRSHYHHHHLDNPSTLCEKRVGEDGVGVNSGNGSGNASGGGGDGNGRVYRKSISSDGTHQQDIPHSSRSVSDSDYHYSRLLMAPYPRRRSSSSSDHGQGKLDFEVSDLFMFGCPLALVLSYRKMVAPDKNCNIQRPACQQVYNLFHPTDPLAVRVEPLFSARFSLLPPITIPRYAKYPLGDGMPTHLLECIQSNGSVFLGSSGGSGGSPSMAGHSRRMSDASILSTMSGMADAVTPATISVLKRWWGNKRVDYALYCPEGLANFPTNSLPHLFHASYWESSDAIAFILRQIVRMDHGAMASDDKDLPVFSPTQPREKWIKKRTSVKIKNVAANHRGNDVIVREGAPQSLQARFMYGPLDMVALSGERVDIHIMRDPPGGDWQQVSTEVTDKTGRVAFTLPPDKALSCGMYPVKMVVRGDHTSATMYLTVVPPRTECAVFSIDGSFTASVSVSGKDPKVRAGAVDVVRHWQELGYLIIYVTGRPDMQKQKVVSWLAQHNFPLGLVSFADGLSRDPLGHKADYLRSLMQDQALSVVAAYGSSKDITVYTSIGLKPDQIFIVGKTSKKQQALAQVLTDGYAAHLTSLSAPSKSRPARGDPQMLIPRGSFGLPGQNNALRRRRKIIITRCVSAVGYTYL